MKKILSVSIDLDIYNEIINLWKEEQQKALKRKKTVTKSEIVENLLRKAVKYKKMGL